MIFPYIYPANCHMAFYYDNIMAIHGSLFGHIGEVRRGAMGFLGFLVIWSLGFLVPRFLGFLVSWFLGFWVSKFLGFKVSWFLGPNCSMIPYYQKSIHALWKTHLNDLSVAVFSKQITN